MMDYNFSLFAGRSVECSGTSFLVVIEYRCFTDGGQFMWSTTSGNTGYTMPGTLRIFAEEIGVTRYIYRRSNSIFTNWIKLFVF